MNFHCLAGSFIGHSAFYSVWQERMCLTQRRVVRALISQVEAISKAWWTCLCSSSPSSKSNHFLSSYGRSLAFKTWTKLSNKILKGTYTVPYSLEITGASKVVHCVKSMPCKRQSLTLSFCHLCSLYEVWSSKQKLIVYIF